MALLALLPAVLLCVMPRADAIETIDMLRNFQGGTSSTDNTPGNWNTALCVANNSTSSRDVLVTASFSMGTTGSTGVSATVDYRLGVKTDGSTTYSTIGQRYLDGGSDRGNGMLAWIFTGVSGTGTCDTSGTRFIIEHRDDNASRTVNTDRITLLAIPLDTTNISLEWARVTQGDSTTDSTTSTSFEPVDSMSAVVTIDPVNSERAAYVVATLSSDTTNIVDDALDVTIGEWTLQGSADSTNGTDGTWVNIGSAIPRSMDGLGEPGMIQLTAVVDGLDSGTYYFRLASLTQDTNEPVVTARTQLAAVSLVFLGQGGGYFPWFKDTYTSSQCDATSSNNPDTVDGEIAANVEPNTTCDESTPDPLSDGFTLDAASDVFTTFVINASTTQSGSGDVGSFEAEIWDTAPTPSEVFGHDQNGASNEVERVFFDNATDEGAMGQVAVWDSGDTDNAAGTYTADGGWRITGNTLESFNATIVGWVGRSVEASRAFITRFDAIHRDGRTDIEWSTVAEQGTVGYHLLRLDESTGALREVSTGLVPGMLDAPAGASYAVTDPWAEPGETYIYFLEEEEVHSGMRRYGPFKVTVRDGGLGAATPAHTAREGYVRVAHPAGLERADRGQALPQPADQQTWPLREARFRLQIDTPGMQFVSAAALAAASGASQKQVERSIRKGRFRLSNRGADVAWLNWRSGTGLLFYAAGHETPYSATDVFWLEAGTATAMAARGGRNPAPGASAGAFTDTIRFEEDVISATGSVTDPDQDFWFIQSLIGGYEDLDTATLGIDAPGAFDMGNDATLTAFFHGLSEVGAGDDHFVVMSMDGAAVADAHWDGLGPQSVAFSFPQRNNLIDGVNTVELTALLQPGISRSWAYLDAVEMTYSRRYAAVADTLLLRGDNNDMVTAAGFGTDEVLVFNVADPRDPLWIKAVAIAGGPEGYSATFKPDAPAVPYMLATEHGFRQPGISVRGGLPELRDPAHAFEYLVIAPADLMDAARALVNYRAGQGLRGMAVDVQHIYDDFSFGLFDAAAIRDFLSYAYRDWSQGPRYVTLMGRGTQDRRNVLGLDDNLIPTNWVSTPRGLAPTDTPYADVVAGDRGAWDIAVARLPVIDAGQAAAVVDKLIGYESAMVPLDRVLLSADNPDHIADFTTFSEKLAAGFDALPLTVDTLHMEDPPVGASHRQDLAAWLQQGGLFWHWTGHGGLDRLAHENLFNLAQVPELANGAALPVLASTTCLINGFDFPGYPSLGERLVTHAAGGILASFSPARFSVTGQGAIASYAFRDALLAPGRVRVGDAAIAASKAYAENGSTRYAASGFVLLGDAGSVVNK